MLFRKESHVNKPCSHKRQKLPPPPGPTEPPRILTWLMLNQEKKSRRHAICPQGTRKHAQLDKQDLSANVGAWSHLGMTQSPEAKLPTRKGPGEWRRHLFLFQLLSRASPGLKAKASYATLLFLSFVQRKFSKTESLSLSRHPGTSGLNLAKRQVLFGHCDAEMLVTVLSSYRGKRHFLINDACNLKKKKNPWASND